MTLWLTDTLWATTILMAAVLALRLPVARVFGARIAYALWLIPAARLFMPPITRTIESIAPVAPAEPLSASAAALETAPAAMASGPDWVAVALTIWLGGAVLFLLWRTAAYIQERDDLLTDARPIGDVEGIRLIEAPLAQGPIALGVLSRYIAVPADFFRRFSERERDLALAHELAHHRSGDLAVNMLAFVMLALHWFNPVAWLAWRAFRFDQEAACDARVLARRGDDDRQIYGKTVAKAALGRALVFASALNNRDQLKKRLRMMKLKDGSGKLRIAGIALVGGAIVAALPLTATVSYAFTQAPTPPEAPAGPYASETSTDIIDADGARTVTREFVDDDGRRRVMRVRMDRDDLDGMSEAEIRAAIPSEEELRAMVPSEAAIRAMMPSEAELRAMIPSEAEIHAMVPDIDIADGCDGSDEAVVNRSRRGADGRETISLRICRDAITRLANNGALTGMRAARTAITRDTDLSASERSEALAELDRAIARLGRASD